MDVPGVRQEVGVRPVGERLRDVRRVESSVIIARNIEPGEYKSYNHAKADLTVRIARYNAGKDEMYLEWYYHNDGDLRFQTTPGGNEWHMTPAMYVIEELGVLS